MDLIQDMLLRNEATHARVKDRRFGRYQAEAL